MRWVEVLASFDFIIKYRKGQNNSADDLSRRPDYMVDEEEQGSNSMKNFLRVRMRVAPDPRTNYT